MATLGGHWGEPTITGDRELVVDGREFQIPKHADVKVVSAGTIRVAHVRFEGHVYVLSGRGQLTEDDFRSRARATGSHWQSIASS